MCGLLKKSSVYAVLLNLVWALPVYIFQRVRCGVLGRHIIGWLMWCWVACGGSVGMLSPSEVHRLQVGGLICGQITWWLVFSISQVLYMG